MILITGKENIANARKLVLRSGLSLELKGLKRHGRSCYSIIKEEFKLKGNKQNVFNQFETLLKKEGVLI